MLRKRAISSAIIFPTGDEVDDEQIVCNADTLLDFEEHRARATTRPHKEHIGILWLFETYISDVQTRGSALLDRAQWFGTSPSS